MSDFNPGDKVIIDHDFVKNVLAPRTPTTERKSLLEHLGRLGNNQLCISKINFTLIKVTVIQSLASIQSPTLMFESENDLNSCFNLIEKFTPRNHIVDAINGSNLVIDPGQLVCLINYTGDNPQIPIVIAPDQKKLITMPVFGITLNLIQPDSSGQILIEGFFNGFNTKGTTLCTACYLEVNNNTVVTVAGASYKNIAIVIDPSQNGLIYLPKQPGGPFDCFESRSFTGVGNNKTQWDWGKTGNNLTRWGKPNYPDSRSMMPRRPNPRHISNTITAQTRNIPNNRNITDYLWIWGQFLDHDLGLIEAATPTESANIDVPTGDQFFPPGNIPFKRSSYDSNSGTLNARQQINTQSSFMDCSHIYGADNLRASALRANDGTGKLDTSPGNLLPKNTRLFANLPNNHDSLYYFAGDIRANEHLLLLAMHTLWVREHNRIATELKIANSHLTDEQLYQSARRKVIALNQAITFNEFLPALLGSVPLYTGYDSTINPVIANEFTTGLFRLGHTLVSETIQRLDANLNMITEGWTSLRDAFFRPDRLLEGGGIEPLLRGAARQICQNIDFGVVDGLRNFLFGNPGSGGLDLAAVNIQRGRDHGLPSYNDTRVALGLTAKRSYSQISSNSTTCSMLMSIYSNINEIDLWIGMLAEDHLPEIMIGETLRAGLLKQFVAIRNSDRFWYQNVFTGNLLDEINNTKLSDIIRRNTTISSEIQDNVFYLS